MNDYYAFPLNTSTRRLTSAFWRNGFTVDQLDRIQALGEAASPKAATVGEGAVRSQIRNGSTSWIKADKESDWLYEKLTTIVRDLNTQYFGYDLWGIVGGLQYTVYDASEKPEYYDWHIDMMGSADMQRKLSLVLQLTNPMDYEGGELRLRGVADEVVPKEQGLLYAFSSFILHQVTPVTKGIRRSLVAWAVGPDFR